MEKEKIVRKLLGEYIRQASFDGSEKLLDLILFLNSANHPIDFDSIKNEARRIILWIREKKREEFLKDYRKMQEKYLEKYSYFSTDLSTS